MNKTEKSVRLQKYLAASGVASRRQAEKLIEKGEIKVNDQVVTRLGTCIDPGIDVVKWRGKIVKPVIAKIYLMLNKPAGFLCSLADPQDRKLIVDLIDPNLRKLVKPVGRLDFNTTGLILLSNDGEFIQRMTHPSHKVIKKYKVKVGGEVTPEIIEKIKRGIVLEDGPVKAVAVKLQRRTIHNSFLLISVTEGRKHLIRKMCEACGLRVVKLSRIAFGPLTLGGLRPKDYRHLTDSEVKMLKASSR